MNVYELKPIERVNMKFKKIKGPFEKLVQIGESGKY